MGARILLGLVWLVVLTGTAHAQLDDPKAVEKYNALVKEAKTAFGSGDYATAAELFTKATTLNDANESLVWNVGRCHEELEAYDEALSQFQAYLAMVSAATPVDEAKVAKGTAKLAAIEAILATKGKLCVSSFDQATGSPITGAAIMLDGDLEGSGTPRCIWLTAGERQVAVLKPGYEGKETTVTITPGATEEVGIALSPKGTEAPPPPPVASGGIRVGPLVTIIAGALALGGGAACTYLMKTEETTYRDETSPYPDGAYISTWSQKDAMDTLARRDAYAVTSYVAYGVGGAAVAGGILWWLLGGDDAPPAAGMAPSIAPTPGGATLTLTGTF